MIPPIITLTTDFGTSWPYVAALKGVILGINPAVQIVDMTHEIGGHNIRQAALCIRGMHEYFPPDTIHMVVVDPGVGSERRLLCVRMHNQYFLAPDNGVLSWAVCRAKVERFELVGSRYWRSSVSATFHGRDILAPVAGHLSLGVPMQELGKPVSDWIEIPWPAPTRKADGLEGEVLAIDGFGNLITNISGSDLILSGAGVPRVFCCGKEIGRPVRTYSDGSVGSLLALEGSSGLLEIAVRDGNAALAMSCRIASPVEIRWPKPKGR